MRAHTHTHTVALSSSTITSTLLPYTSVNMVAFTHAVFHRFVGMCKDVLRFIMRVFWTCSIAENEYASRSGSLKLFISYKLHAALIIYVGIRECPSVLFALKPAPHLLRLPWRCNLVRPLPLHYSPHDAWALWGCVLWCLPLAAAGLFAPWWH